MTKSTIIQRLLDKKHITVEEAMILMQHDTIPVVVPNQPIYPNTQIWYATSTGETVTTTDSTKTRLND